MRCVRQRLACFLGLPVPLAWVEEEGPPESTLLTFRNPMEFLQDASS